MRRDNDTVVSGHPTRVYKERVDGSIFNLLSDRLSIVGLQCALSVHHSPARPSARSPVRTPVHSSVRPSATPSACPLDCSLVRPPARPFTYSSDHSLLVRFGPAGRGGEGDECGAVRVPRWQWASAARTLAARWRAWPGTPAARGRA